MFKVLELFSGTGQLSKAFENMGGYETFTVDWNEAFDADLHCDIGNLTAKEILEKFGRPDVIWMAPDCTTYSLAAISRHRKKNPVTGNLDPISEYAKRCDEINQHTLELLRELNPKLFFIENPRACLQNMTWMHDLEPYKYYITYCAYLQNEPFEKRRMKPTNIWTNHPDPKFKPPCKNGCTLHMRAPRGSKTGTQGLNGAKERATYPKELIEHIVDICDDYLTCQN